ncbi:MAG: glycosyltransferase family 4 protein [Anaerolineales bacterium]
MQVVVDGLIYRIQPHGGISRIYNEVLPRMCDQDADLQVTLLTHGRLLQPVPAHPRITHQRLWPVDSLLRPSRLWSRALPRLRALVQRRWLGPALGRLWHSTYYTEPDAWDGPVVVTVVDMIHERFAHLFNSAADVDFRRLKQCCVMAADAVICISEATRHDLEHYYGQLRGAVHVIPLACDQRFRLLSADAHIAGRPFLLYVGDRNHYKNFWGFLETYHTWPGRGGADVVVVGKPWKPAERQRLRELGLSDHVRHVSMVDDEHLCRLYNSALAFVSPSLYEGFGIPLLEAMACGCPIVASDIPSTREVADGCPLYFDPTVPASLCAALDASVAEGRRSLRVQHGRQRAESYTWDETARRTLEVYRTVSGG